jgi:hypothetical protein
MIPSLTRDISLVQRSPEWPTWPQEGARPGGALFEARPGFRKLVVLADADVLVVPGNDALSPAAVLTGLLTHPYIDVYRYRDEGPPADAPRELYGPPEAGLSPARGWAELLPADHDGVRGVLYMAGSLVRDSAVFGAGIEHARGDTVSASYRERDPVAAADQRVRDVLAAEVAQAVGADLFITDRPHLFELPVPVVPGGAVCQVAEALAMVWLYLRSQHEFIISRAADGTVQRVMNEWLYYQVGAVGLLPELWRWSSACAQVEPGPDSEALNDLHAAVVQRIQRALRTRDSFHRACSLPQNRDAVRTMLVELDALLVTLMGAVDASARFVHILLGLPGGQRHHAGWQRDNWRATVASKDRLLAGLFEPGTQLGCALTILSRLRNTIHGEMIRATMVQRGWARDAPIRLPSEQEKEILDCMDAAGGQSTWGAKAAADKSAVVEPAPFVEQIFLTVVALLNAVMEHTPGISIANQPQDQAGHRWYSQRNRMSIRWQLGL